MNDDLFDRDDPGLRWLREMVDDDLQDLFSEDPSITEPAVRRLIAAASEHREVEARLIEMLETSVQLSNDDTSASIWATVILGEARSGNAVGVLLRSLASDEDEALQDAASVALLRIGAPALEALMDAIEEEDDERLKAPGYALLGSIGVLEDESLRQRVVEFIESRVEVERLAPSRDSAMEPLCRAIAYLGDKSQTGRLKRILAEDFGGRHAGIEDAIALLEESPDEKAIVMRPPWEDRYGWLFDDTLERIRVSRPGGRRLFPGEEEEESTEEETRGDVSRLYWGLTAYSRDDDPDGGYDARRFLRRPESDE